MTRPDPEQFFSALALGIADPYAVYREYRRSAPIHRVRKAESGESEWVVLAHGPASRVLTDRGFGRRASAATGRPGSIVPPGYPTLNGLVDNWMIFMDPPEHHRVRTAVSDWLSAALDAGLRERVAGLITDLVNSVGAQRRVDVVGELSEAAPLISVLEMMGVRPEDRAWLRGHIAGIQEGSSFRPGPRAPRLAVAEEAAMSLAGYFRALLDERRRCPTNDLISRLYGLGWDDTLVVATCVHMMASGHETTRNMLSKATLLLLRYEPLRERLVSEPELVGRAVDEFVRFEPPAQMVHRWAYCDVPLGDHWVRRGDKVTVVIGAANRDPEAFAAPDEVRIDRTERRHLGFGLGGHYCIGSALGRQIIESGVAALARVLSAFKIDDEGFTYSAQELNFHGPATLTLVRK
jgi:cytochrome P450